MTARSTIVALANLLAIFVVVGFLAHSNSSSSNEEPLSSEGIQINTDFITIPEATNRHSNNKMRALKSKGSKGSVEGCIPLDATPAPTKGKGKGKKSKKGSKGSSEAPVSTR